MLLVAACALGCSVGVLLLLLAREAGQPGAHQHGRSCAPTCAVVGPANFTGSCKGNRERDDWEIWGCCIHKHVSSGEGAPWPTKAKESLWHHFPQQLLSEEGFSPLSHFLLLQTAFEGLLVCSRSTPNATACHTGWGLAPFRRSQADPPLPSLKLNPSASHQVTRTIMSQSHQHKSWPGHTEILSFIALPLQPKPWGRQGRELVRSYFLSLNLCSSDMHLLTKWMSYQTSKHISGMCGFICVGDAPACVVTQWEGPLKTAFWEDWFGAGLEAAQLYLPCHAPQSHALGPYGRCLHLAEHDMAWDKDQDNGFSRDETEALQGEGAQGLLCKWSLQVLPLTYPASRVSRQCARRAVTETSARQWYCNSIGLIVTAKWLCAGAVQVKIPMDPSTFTSCHHKQNRLKDWSLTPTKVTVPVSTSLIKVQKARHFSVPN